jgi:hypothetical protein
MDNLEFNEMLRDRTKKLAVRVIKMYAAYPKKD